MPVLKTTNDDYLTIVSEYVKNGKEYVILQLDPNTQVSKLKTEALSLRLKPKKKPPVMETHEGEWFPSPQEDISDGMAPKKKKKATRKKRSATRSKSKAKK